VSVQQKFPNNPSVDVLIERLVRAFQPEYVYIFGSRARGDATDESDHDFMVILPDGAPESAYGWQVYERALKGFDLEYPVDIKFKCRSDFVRQLHLKASIPAAVLRDGCCLYARPGAEVLVPPPAATTPRVGEPGAPEYDPVRVENTRDWIKVARDDLRAADLMLEQEMYGMALFHCQQAVEKAMKALLTWYDEPAPRLHSLSVLGAACINLVPLVAPEVEASYELSRWATNGRYPPPRAGREEAAFGLGLVRQAFDALMSAIPSSVREI
jgi:HEPN domain-containing protein/predicted nucleotidyltransferase